MGKEIGELIRSGGRWAAASLRRAAGATALTPFAGSAYAYITDHLYVGAGAAAVGIGAVSWFASRHVTIRRERSSSRAILENLASLQKSAESFDQRVRIFLDRPLNDARDEELNLLKAAMFLEITERTKAIFDAKKPAHAPFSANVKVLRRRANHENGALPSAYCYEVLTRSRRTASTDEYDAWLKERQIPINENPVYWGILRPAGQDTAFEEVPLYEMHGDLKARVKQLKDDRIQCIEPNQQLACSLMSSYFVHAIASAVPAAQVEPGWYKTRRLYVPGLLCCDTHSKNAFSDVEGDERQTDIALMQFLTAMAFRVFSLDVRDRVRPAPSLVTSPRFGQQ